MTADITITYEWFSSFFNLFATLSQSLSASVYLIVVQPFAKKNSKAKKIFLLLISCSLQRFYFVKKKRGRGDKKSTNKNKTFFGAIPPLHSYSLISIRAFVFFLSQMSLCAALSFSKQKNKVECLLLPMPYFALYSHCRFLIGSSVDDLVHCGFLVSRSRYDELVVRRNVAAEDRRRLLWLEYAGAVRGPPCIQEVIFARAHKPFTTVGEL